MLALYATANASTCKILIPSDAEYFQGDCKNGFAYGIGRAFVSGSYYEGRFINGKPHGRLVYNFKSASGTSTEYYWHGKRINKNEYERLFEYDPLLATSPQATVDWKAATEDDTIKVYAKYIDNWPESSMAKVARERICQISFDLALTKNTIEAYEKYISDYPRSTQSAEAKRQIWKIAFEGAKRASTEKSISEYMIRYPDSIYTNEATQEIERINRGKNVSIEPTKVKKKQKKQSFIKFSMDMLKGGRIDPKYTGYPVVEVLAAILKVTGSKKGEFESTADYNARKTAALAAKFLDGSSLEDILAFTVPVLNGEKNRQGLKYEFNADTGDVNLYALPEFLEYRSLIMVGAADYKSNRRESGGLYGFILNTDWEPASTYQISNAYGASAKVRMMSTLSVGIAANQIQFLKSERHISYDNPEVAGQFKMENTQAAEVLPELKALIVMKLTEPYLVYKSTRTKPTLDFPIDMSSQEAFLTGDVLGIVYYSGRTGEIYARLPMAFGRKY